VNAWLADGSLSFSLRKGPRQRLSPAPPRWQILPGIGGLVFGRDCRAQLFDLLPYIRCSLRGRVCAMDRRPARLYLFPDHGQVCLFEQLLGETEELRSEALVIGTLREFQTPKRLAS
jgi:hypothetical protein